MAVDQKLRSVLKFIWGNTVFRGLEGGREYGGESGSGVTMKG